jgi:hypothetical protein
MDIHDEFLGSSEYDDMWSTVCRQPTQERFFPHIWETTAETGTIPANRLSADTEGAFARAKLEDEVLSAPPVPRLSVGRKHPPNQRPKAASELDTCGRPFTARSVMLGAQGFNSPAA